MVEVTLNTVLYGLLTIIIGLAIHLLFAPKKKVDGEIAVTEFDDLVKDVDDWVEEEEEEEKPAVSLPKAGPSGAVPSVAPSGGVNAPTAPRPAPSPKPEPAKIVTHDKHGNLLPFQIGDRVVLQKLSGQKELNGRHAVIAASYDPNSQRYPVDLDLIDDKRRKKPSLSVKGDNLKKESDIVTLKIPDSTIQIEESDDDKKDGDEDNKDDKENSNSSSSITKNGCLIPHHAKAASFIWDVYRKSVVSSMRGAMPPGTTPPQVDMGKVSQFGWENWKSKPGMAKHNKAGAGGFCDGLGQFLCKGILMQQKLTDLDKNVSPDSNNPVKGAYKLVTEAMQSRSAVKGWNVRIEGDFWIVKADNKGTYVSYAHNTRQIYLVQGYQFPLVAAVTRGGKIQFPRPPKFYLCLVPWYGTLIHDPLIRPTTGTNQIELASPQLTGQLKADLQLAEQQKRIITSIRQLDVQGGNTEGLPYQPPTVTTPPPNVGGSGGQPGQPNMPQMKQGPATEGERILVDNLTDFPNVLQPPMGMWSILPEIKLNPNANENSYVILSGNGQKLGDFTSKNGRNATAEDYLKGVLTHCSSNSSGQSSDRPSMIGVDNPLICQRLQFLIHGKVPKCQVVMLQVKKKPAGQQGGGPPPGGPHQGGGGTSFAERPPFPLPE